MKLFRTKIWYWWDSGILKLCCILLGMIAGAYLSDFVKGHVWTFAVVAVIAAIHPAVAYFKDND